VKLTVTQTAGARRAFTLIEMILAIGLAALVLVAVNAVLFTALHLRNATSDAVAAATPLDEASTFIERDLACAVTPTNGTSKVLSGAFRVGTIESEGVSGQVAIELVTADGAVSDALPWGDLQRVTYELQTPSSGIASGRNLVRSVCRNLLSVNTPTVTDQVLLTGVSDLKFSCYDGAQWNDTWDTSNPTATNTNLPVAVRVDIQMAGSSPTAPIELVVPIDSVSRSNVVLSATGS
jgi:type II secretion system protein J